MKPCADISDHNPAISHIMLLFIHLLPIDNIADIRLFCPQRLIQCLSFRRWEILLPTAAYLNPPTNYISSDLYKPIQLV